MKFHTQKSDISKAITNASRFCHGKIISSTALGGVYLQAKNNELIIKSSNLNDFFETKLTVEVLLEGEVLVDAKNILEFVVNLPEGTVEFEKTQKSFLVTMGQNRGEFPLLNVAEFVNFPQVDGEGVNIGSNLFESLSVLQISISKDESKPAMTGLRFAAYAGEGCLVSTDGFRLSMVCDPKLPSSLGETVSSSFLGEVIKLAGEGSKIDLVFDKKPGFVLLEKENSKIYSRLIIGEYPPYERVVREDFLTKATVSREEMLRSLRLISVFVKNTANVVVMKITKGGIFLTQKNISENPTQSFVETASFEGEELSVAFNVKYLMDYFSAIKASSIQIATNPGNTPVVFTDPQANKLIHIIMPLRLD